MKKKYLFSALNREKSSRGTEINTNLPGLKLGNLHEDLMPPSEHFLRVQQSVSLQLSKAKVPSS